MSDEPKLRITLKALRQLQRKKLTPEVSKLEDKKRRDEIHTRDRARRKAMFEAAKTTDIMLTIICDEYKKHIERKKMLISLRNSIENLEDEAKILDDRIKKLQIQWRAKREAYGKAKTTLNEFTIRLTEEQDNVQAAFDTSQAAWDKLNPAMIKKHRDRKAKKRAKEILRDR